MGQTINMTQATVKRVHGPVVGGVPMYVRVDGTADAGGTQLLRSEDWQKMAQRVQTSPNNIKRVFITRAGVYVERYRHMTGSKGTRSFMKWSSDMQEVVHWQASRLASGEPLAPSIKGAGLGAIDKPWVCSNIEEVYFDTTVLFSVEVMNSGLGNLFAQLTANSGQGNSRLVKALFMRFGAHQTDEQTVLKKFPRLKYVGYIDELDKVYRTYDQMETERWAGDTAGKAAAKLVEKFTESPVVMAAVRNPNIATHIWNTGRPRLNPEYTVRPGIYVYDRDVLDGYFSGLSQQITNMARANARGQAKPEVGTAAKEDGAGVKSDLERSLDRVYAAEGEATVTNAIAIILSTATSAERQAEYDKMSKAGQKRYGRFMMVDTGDRGE